MLENSSPTTNIDFSKSAQHIIRYWRHSLTDIDRMGFMQSTKQGGVTFKYQQFKAGTLPREKVLKLFHEAEYRRSQYLKDKYKSKAYVKTTDQLSTLQVLIAPFHLVKKHYHGKSINVTSDSLRFYPLIVSATLDRSGDLSLPENEIMPWIDRRCLIPNARATSYPFLGRVEDLDRYYEENQLYQNQNLTWDKYLEYAICMFKYVIDSCPNNDYTLGKYEYISTGMMSAYSDRSMISRNILKTYEELIENPKKIPKIMQSFCSIGKHQSTRKVSHAEILERSKFHYGQMQNKFPLSNSQRKALSCLSDEVDSDIFTINGPPGTGKTALLLTVTVSKWIQAIVDGDEYPPVTVAASTNNQAVTNILDHFNRVNDIEDKIRWLPDLDSFGLYLVSSTDSVVPYLHIKKGKHAGNIWHFNNEKYNRQASGYYLSSFNKFFGKSEHDLNTCALYLKEKIVEMSLKLSKFTSFASRYCQLIEKIKRDHGTFESLKNRCKKAKKEVDFIRLEISLCKDKYTKWLDFKSRRVFWLRLFSFLPPIKTTIKERALHFLRTEIDEDVEDVQSLDKIDEYLLAKQSDLEAKYLNAENILTIVEDLDNELSQLVDQKNNIEDQFKINLNESEILALSEKGLLALLDTTLRYEMFLLATHYWEAKWLLASQQLTSFKYTKQEREKFWQIHAMLTPCLVTTLHTGPSFFQHTNSGSFETLTDFIDLLIIDEAGQTLPLVAGALVSVSKRLLLVGDKNQIEPIVEMPQGIDNGNVRKYIQKPLNVSTDTLRESGLLCSGDAQSMHSFGNLMTLGQRLSKFNLDDESEPGLMLKEHRRCVDPIIAYCNELTYKNMLVPMVGHYDCGLPPMGYAHILGSEAAKGSSRFNRIEAVTIADWIGENKNYILQRLKKSSIQQCVGIVTPFYEQVRVIKSALTKLGISGIKVGTIHSFQGGEYPIMIFSPVYTSEGKQDNYFFDISKSMLNVAVSRAKLSFLVFGDMNIFDERKYGLPSTLLAKYLFASECNEIKNVAPRIFENESIDSVRQLLNLHEHREYLAKSFVQAKKNLIIVSPYLTVSAIKRDNIIELIRNNTKHLKINIFTDPDLNGQRRENFEKARDLLVEAGASVSYVSRVHTKLLVIDNNQLSVGSFNWLSSSREDKFKMDEISFVYSGRHAEQHIEKAMGSILDKVYEEHQAFCPHDARATSI